MRTHRGRRVTAAAFVAVLLVGCGRTALPAADEIDLTAMATYGCGYGFWLGSTDGRSAVRLAAAPERAVDGALPAEATLPDPAWEATVLLGTDLYANWCDDVLEPGEPEPVVVERWPITAGTISLVSPATPAGCPSEVRAQVRGLVATTPDGTRVDLGDRDVVNDTWGCFAG